MDIDAFNINECNNIMLMGPDDLRGKKVLVRCDYNVPLDKTGNIKDDTRIRESLPTIKHLIKCGAKVILCSHHGKYKDNIGKDAKTAPVVMQKVANRITELLSADKDVLSSNVQFVDDREVVGKKTLEAVEKLKNGDVLMLQNTRLLEADEKNREFLARRLASLCDMFVFNAFGTAHREQASTMGLMRFLTSQQIFVGNLIEQETKLLNELYNKNGIVAIFGGSKLEDKLETIKSLITNGKLSKLVIVGKMALPFLINKDYEVGSYDVIKSSKEIINAEKIISLCGEYGVELVLPKDMVCATESVDDLKKNKVESKSIRVFKFTDGEKGITDSEYAGLDIGSETIENINQIIESLGKNNTVILNGTAGLNEAKQFSQGTERICKALLLSNANVYALGGDGVSAIKSEKKKITDSKANLQISTGGGASLEYLTVANLPVLSYIVSRLRKKYKSLVRKPNGNNKAS